MMQIDINMGFYFTYIASAHAKFPVCMSKLGLCQYMMVPLEVTNAPETL